MSAARTPSAHETVVCEPADWKVPVPSLVQNDIPLEFCLTKSLSGEPDGTAICRIETGHWAIRSYGLVAESVKSIATATGLASASAPRSVDRERNVIGKCQPAD